jgi:DNA-binding beta-propeller fold protein YncE
MELWTAQYSPGSSAEIKKVLSLPDIGLLNGVERWDDTRVLVADSNPGRIYLIDVAGASASIPITDDLAALPENPFLPIAANGVRVSPDRKYVYFSNSAKLLLGRVPVDADAKPTGPGEVVMQGTPGDDFAFSKDGKSVYLTTHTVNTVVQIDISGNVDGSAKPVTVAGAQDKLEIPGSTAVAWGRGKEDANTLYVVTAGGLSMPVNGQVEPAKVAAIDFA